MPPAREWKIEATFDTQEQATHAVAAIMSLGVRKYKLAVIENGRKVWREEGLRYGVRNVSI